MIAWVSLDNLFQQAGSALSLQNPTGADVFDGIVFGERTVEQWMNGSNNFQRTPVDNFGDPETVAEPGEVMIAIVHDDAGTITIYRDGAFYADATQGALQTYPGAVSNVLIGLRHQDAAGVIGTVSGADPYLAGFVNEARLYSGALTADDILDIFFEGPTIGTEGLVGDVNGDNVVDRMDAAIVLRNLGRTDATGVGDGDLDGDQLTGLADLAIVQSHLGDTNLSPQASAVPEPAGGLLLLAGFAGLWLCRVRRARR
jgi:hypothetical protein